jgi:hypothetical protein
MGELPDPGENHFDCSTHAGAFDVWNREVSAASGAIAGSAYFRSYWVPGQWAPNAKIVLRGKEKTDLAGISYARPTNVPDATAVYLEYAVAGGGEQKVWFKHLLAKLGADLRFELRWTGNRLEARFPPAEEWAPIPLNFTPDRITLVCSSAEVIFHNVTVASPAP